MPMVIACGACKSRMTVQDNLVGRVVRCPKCATALTVPGPARPAAPTRSSPPVPTKQPRQPAPAPSRTASPAVASWRPEKLPPHEMVTVSAADVVEEEVQVSAADVVEDEVSVSEADVVDGPDFPPGLKPFGPSTFDEEEVPPRMRQGIETELREQETIAWLGRPSMKLYGSNAWIGAIGGLVFFGIGLGLLIGMLPRALESENAVLGGVLIGFFGGMFMLFGATLIAAPWWLHRFRNYREVYVITNQRALLCRASLFRGATIDSYEAYQLLRMKRTNSARLPGAGDLVFEYLVQTQEDGTRTKFPKGFLLVEQVAQVERLLRRLIQSL